MIQQKKSKRTLYPTPTADMKVPKNAKVKIEPKLRKKLS